MQKNDTSVDSDAYKRRKKQIVTLYRKKTNITLNMSDKDKY